LLDQSDQSVRGFASSYSERSPIRGLRSGRLVGISAALGFGIPSNSRQESTSNIFYLFGPLLFAAFALVQVGFPPTQPMPEEKFRQPTPDVLIRDRRDAIWRSGAQNCRAKWATLAFSWSRLSSALS
jgi:hypothetical protein